jgi:hypothetical protein
MEEMYCRANSFTKVLPVFVLLTERLFVSAKFHLLYILKFKVDLFDK